MTLEEAKLVSSSSSLSSLEYPILASKESIGTLTIRTAFSMCSTECFGVSVASENTMAGSEALS